MTRTYIRRRENNLEARQDRPGSFAIAVPEGATEQSGLGQTDVARTSSLDLGGVLGLTLLAHTEDKPTPCGSPCAPYNDHHCILGRDDESDPLPLLSGVLNHDMYTRLAQNACRRVIELNNAQNALVDTEHELDFWRVIAQELSVNEATGLITGNALPRIVEHLYKTGLALHYRSKGYRMRVLYGDIDNLKQHNAGPGAHAQGDLAIEAVSRAVASCFTRSTDIRILDSSLESAPNEEVMLVSRTNDAGDEVLVISFFDPEDESRQATDAQNAVSYVEKKLDGLSYSYEDSTYPVSMSFAVMDCDIPIEPEGVFRAKQIVDRYMMVFKSSRSTKNSTAGIVVPSEFTKGI